MSEPAQPLPEPAFAPEPQAGAGSPGRWAPAGTARLAARHLLAFVLPTACLAFAATAPHPWWASPLFLGVIAASIVADMRSPSEVRQPDATMPSWPFDAMLYALGAMHLVGLALLLELVAAGGFFSMDTLVGVLLFGVNSGYSAIVVAHEWIHRREPHRQWLGRVLLMSVLYDHFAVEHIRGHHARVATADDPATARFGESALAFLRRTVPAQFRSAWLLEKRRLGDPAMPWHDRRMLRHRVLHGLLLEWGAALAVAALLGPGAFAVFLLQAAIAVRLLEAVNYFEHYGLQRASRRVRTVDSWDTDSRFTLYTLVGLSRHADHHAFSTRPYQQLRHFDESPKLPYGYFGTVAWLLWDNRGWRRWMEKELRRRRLGPFDPARAATTGAAAGAAA